MYIRRRRVAAANLRRPRRSGGKKKFLRKYKKGLGSVDKIYAFKRLGQDIQLLPSVSAAGSLPYMATFINGVEVTTGGVIKFGATSPELSPTGTDRTNYKQCGGAMQFNLANVENVSEFKTLFDAYKISGVKVKIHYVSGVASAQQGWAERPTMLYSIDEDDDNIPNAETLLRQRNDVKQYTFGSNKPLVLYIKPKAATALYSSGVSSAYTGYGQAPRQWIDCSSDGVPHYGLKFWLRNLSLPAANPELGPEHFRIELSYYLKFKGVQ